MRYTRRAMTMVEALISVLVGITVMGVAFSIYRGSILMSEKAQGITAAAQVAAVFFNALESDLANIIPQPRDTTGLPTQTFETDNGEANPSGTPGVRSLRFFRRTPGFPIKYDSFDYQRTDKNNAYGRTIIYEAKKDAKTGLFDIRREIGEGAAFEREIKFEGGWAEDVRFSAVKMSRLGTKPRWFLRVTLLLVGKIDPADTKAAMAAKPVVLTTLYNIPYDDSSDTGDMKLWKVP